MIIENDIDNISHVSVLDLKDEELEENKSNVYLANKEKGDLLSLNLSSTKNNNKDDLVQIYFRNYIPNDKNFLMDKLQYFEKISEIENHYDKKMRKSVKDFINLEKNPMNLVPKKNNSDLKRNLAKKLEKLNRKTEIAILKIIKENINRQKAQITEAYPEDNNQEEEVETQKHTLHMNDILTAANMQYNLAESELLRENEEFVEDDEKDEVSSNYDQGISDY
jgi:coiled-coil domain-containing protein 12